MTRANLCPQLARVTYLPQLARSRQHYRRLQRSATGSTAPGDYRLSRRRWLFPLSAVTSAPGPFLSTSGASARLDRAATTIRGPQLAVSLCHTQQPSIAQRAAPPIPVGFFVQHRACTRLTAVGQVGASETTLLSSSANFPLPHPQLTPVSQKQMSQTPVSQM
jgi:hypothetical protein